MKPDYDQINKTLRKEMNWTERRFLLQELPKGEALFKQVNQNDRNWGTVTEELTKIYMVLNHQLGLICQAINYPLNQWEWPDSKPLEILAMFYEGIQESGWYTRHLNSIVLPANDAHIHPWLKITI